MNKNNIFGSYVSDEDKSLVISSGGSFGLNTGNLSRLEFGEVGSNGTIAFSFNVKIGEREYFGSVYKPNRVYKDRVQLSPSDEGYEEALNKENNQAMGTIVHVIKSLGITDEQLKKIIELKQPTSFEEWGEAVTSLVPKDFSTIKIDVFLQYQYKIADGQDKTFLELPRNMMNGRFISPHQPGNWKEVNDSNGLKYVDGEKVHPIVKSKYFMDSNNATQQGVSQGDNGESDFSEENAKKDSWG